MLYLTNLNFALSIFHFSTFINLRGDNCFAFCHSDKNKTLVINHEVCWHVCFFTPISTQKWQIILKKLKKPEWSIGKVRMSLVVLSLIINVKSFVFFPSFCMKGCNNKREIISQIINVKCNKENTFESHSSYCILLLSFTTHWFLFPFPLRDAFTFSRLIVLWAFVHRTWKRIKPWMV